jgi:hypothetical protein
MPSIRNSGLTVVGALVMGALLAFGAYGLFVGGGPSASKAARSVITAYADYEVYPDMNELNRQTTAVIVGSVIGFRAPTGDQPRSVPIGNATAKAKRSSGVVSTAAIVRVRRVISGRLTQATVRVSQLGGSVGNTEVVMEGDPAMQRGHSYVYFLRLMPDGEYTIVGGLQGRYAITGGRLAPVSPEARLYPVPSVLAGLRLSSFVRGFYALLRSPSFGQQAIPGRKKHKPEKLHPTPRHRKPKAPPGPPPHP